MTRWNNQTNINFIWITYQSDWHYIGNFVIRYCVNIHYRRSVNYTCTAVWQKVMSYLSALEMGCLWLSAKQIFVFLYTSACRAVAAVHCQYSPSRCDAWYERQATSRWYVVPVAVADVEQPVRHESHGAGGGAPGARINQGTDPRVAGAGEGARRQRVASVWRSAAARHRPKVHDGPVSEGVRSVPDVHGPCQPAAQAHVRRVDRNHSTERSAPTTRRPAGLRRPGDPR